jgi:CRISPR-associated endoribonuclease Cas6
MRAVEIIIQENPDFSEKTHFLLGSPVFIQRNIGGGKKKFYFLEDAETPDLMVETLRTKMKIAGVPEDETLRISFDQHYHRKGTKKVDYKHSDQIIQIRANWCPLIIEGKAETKAFAWNVGIGNSTGIGFGSIK